MGHELQPISDVSQMLFYPNFALRVIKMPDSLGTPVKDGILAYIAKALL